MATRTGKRKSTRKTTIPRQLPATRRPGPAEDSAAAAPMAVGGREGAETLLADARDRAADIEAIATEFLNHARRTAAAEVAELRQGVEAQAAVIRRAAVDAARRVLVEAADEAGERLRRAETEAEQVRTAVGAEAEAILGEARAGAEAEAAEILRRAEEQVQEVLAEVEDRAAELAAIRRAAAEAAYRTALDDAAQIRGTAQEQANQAAAALTAAEAEVDIVRRRAFLELDEERARRRAEIDDDVADYRKQVQADFAALGEQHVLTRHARLEELNRELETLRAKAASESAAITDRASKDAQAVQAAAERKAAAIASEAAKDKARAEELLARAEAAAQRTSKRKGSAERVWKSAPWIALAAGVGLAASGEFALARLVGFHQYVAPLFPLSVDIYAIVAFKKKSDVGPALSIMAASNLAYHLAERGGVHDPSNANGPEIVLGLTALVVLTFVIIIWRVHRLLDGGHETTRTDGQSVSRTERDDPARTADRTEPDRTTRTADRTEPDRTTRTADRTEPDRTARTAATRTARTATRTAKTRTGNSAPARTDAECISALRELPRTAEGFVTVNAARTALGCNRDRAVRLLDEAKLLSRDDRAKHLTPAR